MSIVEDFLTAEQEQSVINAIKIAEKNTSGEIRVHIEKNANKPPFERAKEVFKFLKMDQTHLKNGVLFYLAIESKHFAVIGDEGIHKQVPDNFWETIKNKVLTNFAERNYAKGLEEGILEVGNQLKTYFPYEKEDINELPDEISKGE
jgi:uncharacterized membrane protein